MGDSERDKEVDVHRKELWTPGVVALLLAVVVVGAGCSQKSPEEQVAQIRARYVAEVNQGGFYVEQEPAEEPEMATDEDLAEDAAEDVVAEEPTAEDAAEAAEGEAEEVEASRQNVVLDILVRHDSNKKLPGITVDIYQEGADGTQKQQWRLWVETADLEKGNIQQVRHVIEGIDYVEGDRFAVEVRHPIPAAERGEYKEFAAAGP